MYNIYNFKQNPHTPDSQTKKERRKNGKRENTIHPSYLNFYHGISMVAQIHTSLFGSQCLFCPWSSTFNQMADGSGIVKFNRIKPLYYSNAQNTLCCVCIHCRVPFFSSFNCLLALFVRSTFSSFIMPNCVQVYWNCIDMFVAFVLHSIE